MTTFSGQILDDIDFAAELLREARHAIVLTGAGLSTPSGIPDFRSAGTGLWAHDEPLEVASLTTFRTHPVRFFEWFRPLAAQMVYAQPNPAHLALARLEAQGHLQAVITQNVDMLHQKAGSKHVLEMHGTLSTLSCTQCYQKYGYENFIQAFIDHGEMPLCPVCGALLKPDVILFGEQLPQKTVYEAQQEVRKCDLVMVIGSSLEVLPVAGIPMQAIEHGAHLIIINNSPTYINVRADIVMPEDVAKIIPAIVDKV